MTIVKYVDKKTGRVSVYESTPHYDPVSKQSRPRRKYLGTLDPETGELVPSSGRPGRRPGSKNRPKAGADDARGRRNDEETRTETKPQAPAAEAEERGDVRQEEDSVLRERVTDLERRVAELELERRRDWERGLAEAAAGTR